ncbi:hypothetical protein TSMEX_006188 [Taenia solium]|eukprot:TsM_000313700 transcript=TsM_000313700 gene=TsM_000313700
MSEDLVVDVDSLPTIFGHPHCFIVGLRFNRMVLLNFVRSHGILFPSGSFVSGSDVSTAIEEEATVDCTMYP